ncbi:putative bifunctional diguanylate cyclase/phosphodiesterase [Massilia soli]|uniref:EAL domain-containing protein n=2 Tax=Pseudomonadota TaxID=1224 RepID=A0ABS7SKU1_9BURK|nr:GGDEF and EAL domain-containing protein [Massilia soli]MBZ2206811.1 EAL domain-containing protein [Massilia soli]
MEPSSLAEFIRNHTAAIVDEWVAFARELASAQSFTDEVLRDHILGILAAIEADLLQPQTGEQQALKARGRAPRARQASEAEQHGSARLLEGVTVHDAMAEFRALRASILRLWTESAATRSGAAFSDLVRFNEAIDQALSESLVGFSEDKERSTRLFETLLSSSPDLSFILDREARLIYANAAVASLYGMAPSALRGKRFGECAGADQAALNDDVRQAVLDKGTRRGELTIARAAQRVTYEYLLVPVLDTHGEVEAVAGTARDVTERIASEAESKRRAHFDQLTRLPNRSLFFDRLEQEIKRSARIGLPFALLFIDLDGFKDVNDLHGHDAGDALLCEAAARIGACIRDSDTVARLGGDEFTVLITEVRHMQHVDILAGHILDELRRPFAIAGKEVAISGSIGIAVFPQDAANAAELIRRADQAMYQVKNGGRGHFAFFTAAMRESAQARMAMLGELRTALARHQLRVYFQPIVALADNAIVGAEAQLRWQHPSGRLIAAADFVDLAEEAGLAGEIDEWVLNEALAAARGWPQRGAAPIFVSVNKSASGLAGKPADGHWQAVIERLAAAAVPVTLELREAVLLSDAPGARRKLEQLARAGVRVCVDDFGAGCASVTGLTRIALDSLKLDPALVRGADGAKAAMVRAIIAMAHALGLRVIAAGVETHEQKAVLAAAGCDYAQGRLFSGALDGARFAGMLHAAH